MESTENITDKEKYLTAYMQKQEIMLFDAIRKNIDLEIKAIAYATSYGELSKELEEVNNNLSSQVEISNQAARGVESLTLEKESLVKRNNHLSEKIIELEGIISTKNSEIRSINEELRIKKDANEACKKETDELKREYETLKVDLNNLYTENEELKAKLPQKKTVKKTETVTLPTDEF